MDKQEKVIVVHDSQSERIVAKKYSDEGEISSILDSAKKGAKKLISEIENSTGSILEVHVDPLDIKGIEVATKEVEQRIGKVDIWISPTEKGYNYIYYKKTK